jgi:hypothetical protein
LIGRGTDMKLLIAGCSFSSGWGFAAQRHCWPAIVSRTIKADIDNRAQASASNLDVFLQAINDNQEHDVIVVQWTALGRISLSPSPINPSVIVSHRNDFFDSALPGATDRELQSFYKIMCVANGNWKHYFNLISMIEVLQKDPRVIFVNGLLDWDEEFFTRDWSIPMLETNQFIENLLQVKDFDDDQLRSSLDQVISARDRIDRSRWVNLTSSWQMSKIDHVSSTDQHPGIQSQKLFADLVGNFIKDNHA